MEPIFGNKRGEMLGLDRNIAYFHVLYMWLRLYKSETAHDCKLQ